MRWGRKDVELEPIPFGAHDMTQASGFPFLEGS